MVEYVRLEYNEKVYGQKVLLLSQVEIINIIKRFQKYKELRSQELTLKVNLSVKLGELKEMVKLFEKVLPKTNYQEEEKEVRELLVKEEKKTSTLEDELEQLKAKISRLQ
jgi:hypothetical protein